METIYWTKIKRIFDSEKEIWVSTDKYEIIKEEEQGYVPDGDGFQVNMNGISYETYLKAPENYLIVSGVLMEITEEEDLEYSPIPEDINTTTDSVIDNM